MSDKFDSWALVELLGHKRLAGRVSEQVIAGQGFALLMFDWGSEGSPGFMNWISNSNRQDMIRGVKALVLCWDCAALIGREAANMPGGVE